MMDLEVIWCGGMKDTYLCIPTFAPNPLSVGRPMTSSQAKIPVIDVLPTDRDRAMTMGEVMARTGSNYGVVATMLHRLRKAGVLESVIVPGRQGSGREPRLYWRKAA